MKIKVYFVIMDAGDGSAYLETFRSEAEMEEYLDRMEEVGERDLSEGGSYEFFETSDYEVVE